MSVKAWQLILNQSDLYNGNGQLCLNTITLNDALGIVRDLDKHYDGMNNIFHLKLFCESNGKYSGAIYNDDKDDLGNEKLWISFESITDV